MFRDLKQCLTSSTKFSLKAYCCRLDIVFIILPQVFAQMKAENERENIDIILKNGKQANLIRMIQNMHAHFIKYIVRK